MTIKSLFPETVEVSGSGRATVDGVYSLKTNGEPKGSRWGFVYCKVDSQVAADATVASLRYGENLPEVGGPGFVGWVIGNFSHKSAEVIARCIRSQKTKEEATTESTAYQWEIKDAAGNFSVFPGFVTRTGGSLERTISVCGNRALWRLESLRDKLKHLSPGQGIESEVFCMDDAGEYRLVLYPFGTASSAPGCVSLVVKRTGGPHRIIRLFLRIGNSVSGHKFMAGSEFAVDFARVAISGRLESLEAELNIVL